VAGEESSERGTRRQTERAALWGGAEPPDHPPAPEKVLASNRVRTSTRGQSVDACSPEDFLETDFFRDD